ncbi:MAG: glycoside hydrolase family protein [Candidatus Gastranaerophilales bacterium]|nr:glycoside hydrolase family protein [Candidatus Gastranaerophilales bacterium]
MNIEKLKESIKKHEGLRLKVYICPAGKLTIGYGRNLEDRGITEKEANIMLENDILDMKLELEDRLPLFKYLDDVRQNVLIEMAFNIGIKGLLNFKKTLEYISIKDYDKAGEEMLNSKWANQVGKRAITLSNLLKKGEF